jgi:RHS repeat-associated protein
MDSDIAYGNGTSTSLQYDNRHRPVSITTEKDEMDLLYMLYQYDSTGNILQLEYDRRTPDNQWVQSTEVFQYDWLDRLVSSQGDYGSMMYSYDPVGNRSALNDLDYTYNIMNELVSINDGTQFTYDENGNTCTRTDGANTWLYTYDIRNLLTQVEKNQQIVAQYEYDGDGHRIQKTEWIDDLQQYQTLIYVYSGSNVIYEKNPNTEQEATYVYGPTGRVAKNVDGLTDYYHTDHLGSTRLVTDESGNVVEEVEYDPFGQPGNEPDEHYLFTGKERDSTGLYYYGARYYDPETGRFVTRDPAGGKTHLPQSLNRYTYCLNNPLKYSDPGGLSSEDVGPLGPLSWDEIGGLELRSVFCPALPLFSAMRAFWGPTNRNDLRDYLEWLLSCITACIRGTLDKLYTALVHGDIFSANIYLLALMSELEAIVNTFGDVLGISGAFICIDGMAQLLFGVDVGLCYMYHPDLGWGLYTYSGWSGTLRVGAGISVVAGFFTWHNNTK